MREQIESNPAFQRQVDASNAGAGVGIVTADGPPSRPTSRRLSCLRSANTPTGGGESSFAEASELPPSPPKRQLTRQSTRGLLSSIGGSTAAERRSTRRLSLKPDDVPKCANRANSLADTFYDVVQVDSAALSTAANREGSPAFHRPRSGSVADCTHHLHVDV